jgi:hypothetical protein
VRERLRAFDRERRSEVTERTIHKGVCKSSDSTSERKNEEVCQLESLAVCDVGEAHYTLRSAENGTCLTSEVIR